MPRNCEALLQGLKSFWMERELTPALFKGFGTNRTDGFFKGFQIGFFKWIVIRIGAVCNSEIKDEG